MRNPNLGVTAVNHYLKVFGFGWYLVQCSYKNVKPVCVLVWCGLLAEGRDKSTRIFSGEEGFRNGDLRNSLLSRANILLNRAVLSAVFQVSLGLRCWIKCKLFSACFCFSSYWMKGHVKLISLCMSLHTSSLEITGHQGAW